MFDEESFSKIWSTYDFAGGGVIAREAEFDHSLSRVFQIFNQCIALGFFARAVNAFKSYKHVLPHKFDDFFCCKRVLFACLHVFDSEFL